MPMYNLIEYNDNFSDTSGSLLQFKRDKVPADNGDLTINNSQSFRYKVTLLGKAENAANDTNSSVKEAKIFVPLKYFSNFWRSLEMVFINCKIYLELNWIEDYILSSAGSTAKLAITHTKLHFPIVTLSTKDSANLAKQLNEGFERSVYWNSHETKPEKVIKQGKHLYELPNASFKVLIDGGNFYDQPINDLIKQYDEIRKVSTGYGDDYTTGCLSE